MADCINVNVGYGLQTTEIYLKRLMVGKGDRLRRVCQTLQLSCAGQGRLRPYSLNRWRDRSPREIRNC